MFFNYGFTTYKRKTVIMLLTPYMPFSDPGAGYLKLDAYYLAAHKAHLETADFIEFLKKKGIEAAVFDEPVYKRLALRSGIAAMLGTNSLAYSYYHGCRFVLSAVQISYKKDKAENEFEAFMSELGARRAERGKVTDSINCYKCGQCIKACPMQAIGYNGLNPKKCMRTHMRAGAIPDDETAAKMGGAFWGCDICQRVCPMNRKGEGAMPAKLKKLLKIADFLKNPKEQTAGLAEYIGTNYAVANRLLAMCINVAGNSGNKKYAPLIAPHLDSQSQTVRIAAARAMGRLKPKP